MNRNSITSASSDDRPSTSRRQVVAGLGAALGATLLGTPGTIQQTVAQEERWDVLVGSCWEGGKILRFDGITGKFKNSFADAGELVCAEGTAVIGRDGMLYVTNFNPGRIDPVEDSKDSILRYDPASGEFVGEFSRPSELLNGPHGLAFGPDDNLYVGTRFTNSVLRYERESGELLGEFVTSGDGGLKDVSRLVFGPDGALYVLSLETASVLRFDGERGEFVDEFIKAGSEKLSRPHDLVFGPDELLYVSSWPDNRILRFDSRNGEFVDEFVKAGEGGLNYVGSMAFGPDDQLYVSSCINNRVLRFDNLSGEYRGDLVRSGSGGLNGTTFMLFMQARR